MRGAKLGEQDGDFFAVAAGLSPGDVVVTDGADRLRDGAKVSIPDQSKTPASPAAPSGPRAHGHWQGQGGGGAGGHGNGQHHHRPGNEDQPSSQPPPPGQPPAPVTPQPPAQQSR